MATTARWSGWLSVAVVGAATLAAPLHAQEEERQTPAIFFGVQGNYGQPVGEFRDYVRNGGGLDVNVVWPVQRGSPFALRADGGFLVYGSETMRICFPTACRVQLDLSTTNSIAFLSGGPQLMVPAGPVRPYVNAAAGISYFATTSSLSGSSQDEDFANTTNFDDITFLWAAGGGLLVRLGRSVFLDVSARYHANGEVEYLKEGDIEDTPDGVEFTPTRSQANLMTYQLGVVIGARPGPR